MKDLKASLEKLRIEATEAGLIAKLATDREKRQLYAKLAEHFTRLADEIEAEIARRENSGQCG